jgi:hypothetical protein
MCVPDQFLLKLFSSLYAEAHNNRTVSFLSPIYSFFKVLHERWKGDDATYFNMSSG